MDASSTPEIIEEASGSPFDLRTILLYGVARSKWWVAILTIVGGAIGFVVAASKPNTYQGHGRLRLTAGVRERITPEMSAGIDANQRAWPVMADELVLLTDIEVFEEAARTIGPKVMLQPADPTEYDGPETPLPIKWLHETQKRILAISASDTVDDSEGSTESEQWLRTAATRLRERTEFVTEGGSSVISVLLETMSPERARDWTNVLLDACVDHHRRVYGIRQYFEQNKEKLLDSYDQLAKSEEAYDDHIQMCGFVELDTQKSTLLSEIGELENELFLKQARYDQVTAQFEDVKQQLEAVPKEVEKVTPAVLGMNPEHRIYQEQKFQLILQKIQLSDPTLAIPARNNLSAALDDQLAQIDGLLKKTPLLSEQVPEITRNEPNPDYQRLQQLAAELRAEGAGLREGIARLQEFLQRKRDRLEAARACDRTHAIMEQTISDRQRVYEQLFQKTSELEVLASLDMQGESNLRVFQRAARPLGKQGPERTKTIMMGLFGGLAAGVGVAALRQLLDKHLRYPRAVERDLGLKLIAVLPELRSARKLSGASTPGS